MTRLERIIDAFNEYDAIASDLAWSNNDNRMEGTLERLRKEVNILIAELKRYGCRRDDKYLEWGFYVSPKRK